VTRSLTVW